VLFPLFGLPASATVSVPAGERRSRVDSQQEGMAAAGPLSFVTCHLQRTQDK